MTLPANIRVNTTVPFPTIVMGSGPVIIKKANGIWTLSLGTTVLAQQSPVGPQLTTDFFIVYDEVQQTWFKVPLSNFKSTAQRSIASAADLPIVGNDVVVNINSGTDLVPIAPLASLRAGQGLTFKNLPGSHVQTITATAPDTLEGTASFPLGSGQSVTLVPYNDGINNALGYAIES